MTAATLNGTLSSTGGLDTALWVFLGTNAAAGTSKTAWATNFCFGSAVGVGTYGTNVTGLTTNTAYYYRFYGSNAAGETWAPATTNFATRGPLAIANVAPTGVTATAAWLNGNLTSDGLGGAEARVYWGLTDMGQSTNGWGGNYSFGMRAPGPLTRNVTGLTANSIYYYRYYATNAQGQVWGDPAMVFVTGASTWSGGAGADDNWSTAANWVGSLAPANPATFGVSFNDNDVGNVNRLDRNWTLNAGLTVANTSGTHTMDLGGNTLTLNGGTFNVGNTVIGSAATFQNGTLVLGSGTAVDVTVGKDANGAASTLNIGGGITAANLRNVSVGSGIAYSGGGYSYGTLDLRNAVPTLRTFAISGNLSIGVDGWSGGTGASGTLYLNDSGGVITNLQVGGNFSLWTGSIVLNSGAAVTIGSSSTPVTMDVGKAHGSQTVSFAPTGPFTAYLSTVTIGAIQWVGFLTGTLDLRNARPTQSTFACGDLNIGSDSGFGSANGSLYLNDGGGVILALQVATNLNFYIGTLTLNTGTSVTIGNGASARGKLALGNNGTATLTPTGELQRVSHDGHPRTDQRHGHAEPDQCDPLRVRRERHGDHWRERQREGRGLSGAGQCVLHQPGHRRQHHGHGEPAATGGHGVDDRQQQYERLQHRGGQGQRGPRLQRPQNAAAGLRRSPGVWTGHQHPDVPGRRAAGCDQRSGEGGRVLRRAVHRRGAAGVDGRGADREVGAEFTVRGSGFTAGRRESAALRAVAGWSRE